MRKSTVKLLKQINQSKVTNLISTIDYSGYCNNPSGFFADVLRVTLTKDQEKILTCVRDNRLTCVPSAHAMGKTFVAAGLVLWWVYGCEGLAITTAPTERQVNNLLWSELRRAWDRVGFPGQRGQTFVRFTESARAFGFTASQQYGADAFQGIHSNAGVLVICDEANGILPEILTGAEACTTGADDRLLLIGNPTSRGTPFEKKCKTGRNPIRIPVWNHPNISWAYDKSHKLKPVIAEQILDVMGGVRPISEWPSQYQEKIQIPGAISIAWIEEVARPKGESSGYWQSRVEARFPEDALRALVPRSWFEAAKLRAWDGTDRGWRFGLDVADGQDCHALIGMNGNHIAHGELVQSFGDRRDVSRAAKMGIDNLKAHPKSSIGVDNVGVGAGALSQVLDFCLENQDHFAIGLNFGGAPTSAQFGNLKAELFWKVRELFRCEEITIDLPDEIAEKLEDDLSGIQWEESIRGKIVIEPKEKFRKRYGRSPDLADALAYAVGCKPIATTESRLGGQRSIGYLAEY